jgi:uncharacterized membrane protein
VLVNAASSELMLPEFAAHTPSLVFYLLMLCIFKSWPIAAIWVLSVPPLLSAQGIAASAAQAIPETSVAASSVVVKTFSSHTTHIVNYL